MAEHTPFPVHVLTPEGELFGGEVQMISTRTTVGSIGVLARHEPLLATLEPTELRLYLTESEILRFAQSEGYMQVGGNSALLLLQEARPPDELDRGLLAERLAEAERELEQAPEGSERRRSAERERRRLSVFLAIADGTHR
ncbi:MAG TPA: F0F1 ATP synthase subunit epsilon [Solirubrobacteraceae bacterium]|nr:F0F1 ATP synthase subunit epsilon [Solirubrobacteraceae bacterium]